LRKAKIAFPHPFQLLLFFRNFSEICFSKQIKTLQKTFRPFVFPGIIQEYADILAKIIKYAFKIFQIQKLQVIGDQVRDAQTARGWSPL
jgi:hypothetical protein